MTHSYLKSSFMFEKMKKEYNKKLNPTLMQFLFNKKLIEFFLEYNNNHIENKSKAIDQILLLKLKNCQNEQNKTDENVFESKLYLFVKLIKKIKLI